MNGNRDTVFKRCGCTGKTPARRRDGSSRTTARVRRQGA